MTSLKKKVLKTLFCSFDNHLSEDGFCTQSFFFFLEREKIAHISMSCKGTYIHFTRGNTNNTRIKAKKNTHNGEGQFLGGEENNYKKQGMGNWEKVRRCEGLGLGGGNSWGKGVQQRQGSAATVLLP